MATINIDQLIAVLQSLKTTNDVKKSDTIIEKIDNALANKNELNNMAERLYDKIHKEHNYDAAIEDFNEVFDNIVRNK